MNFLLRAPTVLVGDYENEIAGTMVLSTLLAWPQNGGCLPSSKRVSHNVSHRLDFIVI